MKGEFYIARSLTTKTTLWGSLEQAEGVHRSLVKPAPSNSSTTALEIKAGLLRVVLSVFPDGWVSFSVVTLPLVCV